MGSRIPATQEHDASAFAYAQWVLAQRGVRNPTTDQLRKVAERSVEITFGNRPARAGDLFEAIGV